MERKRTNLFQPRLYHDDDLFLPKYLEHSVNVYEDVSLRNRPIGFIWDQPKLVITEED